MMIDILGAVYTFLVEKLGISGDTIVRGWQNSAALPNNTDYVVLTLQTAVRHGTNVHQWDGLESSETDVTETSSMLAEHTVQVDFCGQDEQAVMHRAMQLALLARDRVAVEFFSSYGILPLYAEDVRAVPFSNEMRQWETRYIVTLHIECWHDYSVEHDAFTSVNIQIEDVDMHHPITTE